MLRRAMQCASLGRSVATLAPRWLNSHGPGRCFARTTTPELRSSRPQLTGAVFFAIDASNPWVTEAPHALAIAPHIMPGVEHVIEYHVLTAGACWGGIVGEPAVRLEAGDVNVFPQGDAA
jgi:hypothetical protein